jgi:uncharacterized protein
MSDHEFVIPFPDLDAGGKSYSFPVRHAWIRGVLEGHEATATDRDGKLEVRASKSGADVVVRGSLDAELRLPCARCLEPFALPIHADLSVLFVPASRLKTPETGQDQEYEFSTEEADTLPFDGETVALDDLVRDELLLEIPMIPLCSEACPGMSPRPGERAEEPKGIDPRLAPLLAFQDKTKKQS